MITLKITVEYEFTEASTRNEMLAWCKGLGIEPTLLNYIKWLADQEGLIGIIEDGYTLVKVEEVNNQ